MEEIEHLRGVPRFFEKAIKEIAQKDKTATVLDFGCGAGQLVEHLTALGFDAYGCDVNVRCDSPDTAKRLKSIDISSYRLPYDDASFDIIISTSVLEHAQNTKQCFEEIHRLLKPGGYALHILPGKWYLPSEPHIFVPLVNWFWPHCPKWWLALWAFLGCRNEYQVDASWSEVYKQNIQFCAESLCYRSRRYYENLSLSLFGNFDWPMHFFLEHSDGGFAALYRKLPFKNILSKISRDFRMAFLVTRKK